MNSTLHAHDKVIIFLKVSLLGLTLVTNKEILKVTDFMFHWTNMNQQSEFCYMSIIA